MVDGSHIKPESGVYRGMGNSHFHSADALKNEASKKALLHAVRLMDGREDIMGLSTHILGISRKVIAKCTTNVAKNPWL